MNLEELKQFLTENHSVDEVKGLLSSIGFTPQNEVKFDNRIKTLIETDAEARRYIDSVKDSHFSKSLETWKTNNLNSLIEEEVKKRFPDSSPEALKLAELERKIQETEAKARTAELRARARDVAREKQLPFEFIDRFLGDDEETTLKNISDFEKVWTTTISQEVEKKMASNGRDPNLEHQNNNSGKTFTAEEIAKMDSATLKKNWAQVQKLMK
jgi:hypothetical protein